MDTIAERPINFPSWTDYQKKNGLDPLGMQNSSVNLYQSLLPGISNVTLRIRYYGMYAWLCRAYGQAEGDTDPNTWKRCVRRFEALYALTAYYRGGEGGIAGIEWAGKVLNALDGDVVDFAEAAEPGSERYYLRQAWGAYGAAYGSQLFEIGIFTDTETHEIPVLTPDLGEPLADALEEADGNLMKDFFRVIKRGSVSKHELKRFASLTPSSIAKSGVERTLYARMLFGAFEGALERDQSRSHTLQLVLKITELLRRVPRPEDIRWMLFSGFSAVGKAMTLDNPDLERQRQRWWVYHANDLCHVAFETLLKFVLDTLSTHPSGLALERLIPLCVDQIIAAADRSPEDWQTFVDGVQPAENAYSKDDPNSEWSLSHEIIRGAGRGDQRFCEPVHAWKAVKLLAILQKRVRDESRDIKTDLKGFDPDAFRSLLSETRFIEKRSQDGFVAFLGVLIEQRVIRRHLWVAMRKFRFQKDYTFLFEMDDGRLRLRDKDGPVFTNPRLGPAIEFLKDLHLVGDDGLTALGTAAVNA